MHIYLTFVVVLSLAVESLCEYFPRPKEKQQSCGICSWLCGGKSCNPVHSATESVSWKIKVVMFIVLFVVSCRLTGICKVEEDGNFCSWSCINLLLLVELMCEMLCWTTWIGTAKLEWEWKSTNTILLQMKLHTDCGPSSEVTIVNPNFDLMNRK